MIDPKYSPTFRLPVARRSPSFAGGQSSQNAEGVPQNRWYHSGEQPQGNAWISVATTFAEAYRLKRHAPRIAHAEDMWSGITPGGWQYQKSHAGRTRRIGVAVRADNRQFSGRVEFTCDFARRGFSRQDAVGMEDERAHHRPSARRPRHAARRGSGSRG